ncbi:MAG: DNA mismatch repair protein MutS [Spirochaetes bacterium]|nr:DNA mismatch repair protein MutS [Spirochaetota bacterium]
MSDSTPMMQQYARMKRAHRDAVLFFRLGDFYEMFKGDAEEVSRLLGLTLTQRNGVPMCGIPYHAAHGYIARLIQAGKKVAICEQTHVPESGKGLADREVTEIITPGTVTEEDYLEAGRNNYLVAIAASRGYLTEAYIDLSTGEFETTLFPLERARERMRQELARLQPREVLVQETLLEEHPELATTLEERDGLVLNRFPDWSFDLQAGRERLLELLGVANLKGFGIDDDSEELVPVGVLLDYVEDTARSLIPHIRGVSPYRDSEHVVLDEATQRNLEIVQNMTEGSRRYTLLSVVDYTRTAMGARTLRKWLLNPLKDKTAIEARHDRVDALYHSQMLLSNLRDRLGRILDIERLVARVGLDKAHGKDLVAIRNSLEAALDLEGLVPPELLDGESVAGTSVDREELAGLGRVLARGLLDSPSILLTDGNIIREGYDEKLDELKGLLSNSRSYLDAYLEEERAASGIGSLKIKYNKVLGYFFEVTKTHVQKIPEHFVRRQSLVNAERYSTERLAELESRLNSASDQIVELERRLFLELRALVKKQIPRLLAVCDAIAALDCYHSFAWAATRNGYVRPRVSESDTISIRGGRHPVVETHLPPGSFVPNSLELDGNTQGFALITGPNMAGKSTFLRQTALIVLLAQAGSFVPADDAEIGLTDRIFCRVGASDNLARGESTFLVEMNETANILRNASRHSLIIMDEVGRGTSTNDGLAIARAVTEHILDVLQARTLFATHYHELTSLDHARLVNLSLRIAEEEGRIVFLKKVTEGPSNNSYGIHVARLAGLPEAVLDRAEAVLAGILAGRDGTDTTVSTALSGAGVTAGSPANPAVGKPGGQNSLFDPAELIEREVRSVKVDETTPLEALELISRWQRQLDSD